MKSKFDVSEQEKKRILNLVNGIKEKEIVNEQLFGLWKGKKCTVKRCQEDGITDALIGSTKKHPKMTIDNERPKVGDRFRMKESRDGTLTGDSDWSDGHSYKVTKVETPLPVGYTYNFNKLSKCDPVAVEESWDCDGQGNCSDPGTGNGQYTSQSTCQSNCIPPPTASWDCINGTCSDPGTGNGQYSSLNDCETQTNYCTPLPWTCLYEWPQVPYLVNYLTTNSHCYQWQNWSNANNALPSGAQNYATSQDCFSNCVAPVYRCGDCNTPCSQQLIDAGACPYPTTTDCQAMCGDTNKWRCYRDKFGMKKCKKCKVYQMTDGTMCFNTKQECLDSDCGGGINVDDKSFETKGSSSVQTDSPALSTSNEFSSPDDTRGINESDLRRIMRKITKG
jgi:hypothetical protein